MGNVFGRSVAQDAAVKDNIEAAREAAKVAASATECPAVHFEDGQVDQPSKLERQQTAFPLAAERPTASTLEVGLPKMVLPEEETENVESEYKPDIEAPEIEPVNASYGMLENAPVQSENAPEDESENVLPESGPSDDTENNNPEATKTCAPKVESEEQIVPRKRPRRGSKRTLKSKSRPMLVPETPFEKLAMHKLTVEQLKEKLVVRSESTGGKKSDLVARLHAIVAKERGLKPQPFDLDCESRPKKRKGSFSAAKLGPKKRRFSNGPMTEVVLN